MVLELTFVVCCSWAILTPSLLISHLSFWCHEDFREQWRRMCYRIRVGFSVIHLLLVFYYVTLFLRIKIYDTNFKSFQVVAQLSVNCFGFKMLFYCKCKYKRWYFVCTFTSFCQFYIASFIQSRRYFHVLSLLNTYTARPVCWHEWIS